MLIPRYGLKTTIRSRRRSRMGFSWRKAHFAKKKKASILHKLPAGTTRYDRKYCKFSTYVQNTSRDFKILGKRHRRVPCKPQYIPWYWFSFKKELVGSWVNASAMRIRYYYYCATLVPRTLVLSRHCSKVLIWVEATVASVESACVSRTC